MLVDFVGKNHHLRVTRQHVGKSTQFVAGVNGAGWVRRRAKHNERRLWRDGIFKLLGSDFEILLVRGKHLNRLALGKFHHLHVAHPSRSGNNHLIARIHQCQHHVAQLLLGTVAHHNLLGSKIKVVFVFQFCADGFAQRQIARHRSVEREILVNCLLCGFLDVLGGEKIRLANRHVNYVDALRLQFLTLLRHGKCCRNCQCLNSL